jgi:hypothetical protein
MKPTWLGRVEMLGTTIVVVMVGSMMLWFGAVDRQSGRALTIGSAALLYLIALVLFGRRSDPSRIAWWPFALAGLVSGVVAELINANFLVTRELFVAAVTGVVIGTAHWAALRVWIRLTERRVA